MQLSINERGTRWVKRARNTYFYKGLEAVVKGLIERGHAAIRGWPVIFGRNLRSGEKVTRYVARNDAGVDYAAREKERESGHKVPLHAAPALRRTAVMHEARARARPVVTLVKRIVPPLLYQRNTRSLFQPRPLLRPLESEGWRSSLIATRRIYLPAALERRNNTRWYSFISKFKGRSVATNGNSIRNDDALDGRY